MRIAVVMGLVLAGCGGEIPYRTLDAYGLFEDEVAQTPGARTVPYDVNSVLYADESLKLRFLHVPEGAAIEYTGEGVWSFPEGSIAVKTFFYDNDVRDRAAGRRLLETRLIIKEGEGWTAHTYVWNEAQTKATRQITGGVLDVKWIDESGASRQLDYRVPDLNQCSGCHAKDKKLDLLGPKTSQLHRLADYGAGPVNQIDHLHALGMFSSAPPDTRVAMPDPFDTSAPLDDRARAYLDANCAHCHRPGGGAASTGLDLRYETAFGSATGECKKPIAAGAGVGTLKWVVVPGKPEESILLFRVDSTDPDVKMPELPTMTVDETGLALLTEWIAGMPVRDCGG